MTNQSIGDQFDLSPVAVITYNTKSSLGKGDDNWFALSVICVSSSRREFIHITSRGVSHGAYVTEYTSRSVRHGVYMYVA